MSTIFITMPRAVQWTGMPIDFSSLYHESSKDIPKKGAADPRQEPSQLPEESQVVEYKTYPRLPAILLKAGVDTKVSISSKKGISGTQFSGSPINTVLLSRLLLHSCGILEYAHDTNPRRAYLSEKSTYPIEVYPLIFSDSDIAQGVYHYGVRQHVLTELWKRRFNITDKRTLFVDEWATEASLALVLTGVFKRTHSSHGERGYRNVLLEAGRIGQNICSVSEGMKLHCCSSSKTSDREIEKLLDIDGISESVIDVLFVG